MGLLRMILHVSPETTPVAREIIERLMRGVVFNSPVLYTIDDLFERLLSGKMQLWLWSESRDGEPYLFAITLLEAFPRGKVAHVFLAAGKRFRKMADFAIDFEEWAKMQGATYVHFECSPKMAKIMGR